ncbi:MAG: FapA family protein [Clostridiales Family XIII bacterium]|jgi:uncharacterized protein (DUF342 family)|nr:FapA family protein [Clostridiales Family XIII bacterium]
MGKYLIKTHVSGDNMEAFVTIGSPPDDAPEPLSPEDLQKSLGDAKVSWGIDENALRILAAKPMLDMEFCVARGVEPVHGSDGVLTLHVTRSDEYKPAYGGDDDTALVDYKNVDIFQLVKKGQLLCEIAPPSNGQDGTNVFGGVVPARNGKEVPVPRGVNTEWNAEEAVLVASADGTVSFTGETINIMEVLNIQGDVDMSTGNVRFSGDVVVKGSVNEGFIVECGGNLSVKGKIGNSEVRVGGNLLVSDGINGSRMKSITVGGFLRCRYIESGTISADGDIFADYIIDSQVACKGNVLLSGKKSVLVGGKTSVLGELAANYIGNERGIRTRVELMEIPVDEEVLLACTAARDALRDELKAHTDNITKIRNLLSKADKPEMEQLLKQMTEQLPPLKEKLHVAEEAVKQATGGDPGGNRFPGSIRCRRILYSGVDIFAGHLMMQRDQSDLEHCRLYLDKGEWVKGLA